MAIKDWIQDTNLVQTRTSTHTPLSNTWDGDWDTRIGNAYGGNGFISITVETEHKNWSLPKDILYLKFRMDAGGATGDKAYGAYVDLYAYIDVGSGYPGTADYHYSDSVPKGQGVGYDTGIYQFDGPWEGVIGVKLVSVGQGLAESGQSANAWSWIYELQAWGEWKRIYFNMF